MLLRRMVTWLFAGEKEQRGESSAPSAPCTATPVGGTSVAEGSQAVSEVVEDAARLVGERRGRLDAHLDPADRFDGECVDVIDFVAHVDEESIRGPMKGRRSRPTSGPQRPSRSRPDQESPKSHARKDRRMKRRRVARRQHARNC